MGTRTGNPTWQDSPSTATLITAARLNAIENVLDASAASSVTISPGSGLTGGGDLSASRSLALDVEYVQDMIASFLTAGSGVTLTYNDAGNALTIAASGGGGGAAFAGRHLSGLYQFNAASGGSFNEVFTTTAGTLYAVPFWVGTTCTYDQLFTKIGTAGGAGSVLRVGIYNVASTGLPGTLVLDAGTIDTSTTGNKTLTISQSLSAGVYFVVCVSSSSTTQMRALGSAPALNPLSWFGSSVDNEVSKGHIRFTGYTASSALPSTATTAGLTTNAGDIPVITLRAA